MVGKKMCGTYMFRFTHLIHLKVQKVNPCLRSVLCHTHKDSFLYQKGHFITVDNFICTNVYTHLYQTTAMHSNSKIALFGKIFWVQVYLTLWFIMNL